MASLQTSSKGTQQPAPAKQVSSATAFNAAPAVTPKPPPAAASKPAPAAVAAKPPLPAVASKLPVKEKDEFSVVTTAAATKVEVRNFGNDLPVDESDSDDNKQDSAAAKRKKKKEKKKQKKVEAQAENLDKPTGSQMPQFHSKTAPKAAPKAKQSPAATSGLANSPTP